MKLGPWVASADNTTQNGSAGRVSKLFSWQSLIGAGHEGIVLVAGR